MFVPNTRVSFVPALIGSVAAGLTWVAVGFLLTDLVFSSARLQSIYSGFAIMLILMFWLYLSWLILLLGAQLAFYVQHPFHLRFGQRTEPIDNDARERLSLAVMYLIASDFAQPTHGWTNASLAAKLCVPRQALEPIMGALGEAGLVVQASGERLIPGRDPHRILLTDILGCVRGDAAHWSIRRETWNESVDAIADRIDAAIDRELGKRSLGQLVDDTARPSEA
jgi:membrane protein